MALDISDYFDFNISDYCSLTISGSTLSMSNKLPTWSEDRQAGFFKNFYSSLPFVFCIFILFCIFKQISQIYLPPESSTLTVYSVSYLIPASTQPDHGGDADGDAYDDDEDHGSGDDNDGDDDNHGGSDECTLTCTLSSRTCQCHTLHRFAAFSLVNCAFSQIVQIADSLISLIYQPENAHK